MSQNTIIGWERDDDGIVVLTIDDPTQRVNTMNAGFVDALGAALDRIENERDTITGVVVTSGKDTFFAGGDLNDLRDASKDRIDEFATFVDRNSALLRRLETIGRPVVAAVNGSALGGGLELALAAHHRVALDGPRSFVGLPEVTLGLLPGAGGVVRSVRMLGVERALSELLLQGQRRTVRSAHELGIIDELVESRPDLIVASKKWILAHPDAVQPWDVKGFRIPGGAPGDRSGQLHSRLPAIPALLRKQLKGAHYPAPQNIVAAAVESAQVDFDNALRIEARYFLDLATGQIAKNMIQAFFFDMQSVNGARGRSADRTPWRAQKVVVLGAGMMGAGIAYECARAGIDVVLKDVTLDAAERGKGYSRRLIDKQIATGRTSTEKGDALLARITPTDRPEEAEGADLVIEAVFEDPAVKAQVLAEIEPHLADGALIGSNTSTLPITGLAENVGRPEDFIGLHFFSPVDRMPLLEIIKGERTSADTLSRALDLAKQIAKTPIVVNDSRGFFTSRVIGTFINEAMALLGEGVPATTIEQASSQAGYPAPVLQLTDELNLELLRRVRDTGKQAAEDAGLAWIGHPAEAVLDRMLSEFGRAGRLAGAGFYEYDENRKRTRLWTGLTDAFGGENTDVPFGDVVERLLFAEVIETVKCLDEGVLEAVPDANVGSILGIGFPGWTGGVLQFVDGYDGGVAGFVARARYLAETYGERFAPPESLLQLVDAGTTLARSRSAELVGAP
ncbi:MULTISPECIES: 3-hydroxyacyl-CoA dehydrogenase NAD-binding domain-containing protein [Rhodococcus]|uniref:3-hydroxyacyl-CoA dehydrogenase NAD-binding domain-containing protein n=1 Tax=Rhodococcus oxybenzonivorans TaxID=1990687 RepID=A0AAE5A566_9NOCA|nr:MULTISPECIES: 3-hydroxyacyl-CoA dehydrogenase NAD-binding domain-containing protein [Rhodococcus]MDV7243660.1 3-hydroxyacyl-CoA dehydrogenase NAD-binding domain-containing protein [Rhodococcus oxybenzonivorans]MDV7264277.1 3-hydroxyacyl-CoA dehydrogenase NAD-binding domain-containing protein [Rhodococcus oxybenzonivorans]MDV7275098.1 3-hydroxyacyl-CoA dehydrogenase NAD-binding domain-containing protein [Rhodococcus oxybenzonivorans]MDV7335336.1 3-hydroxyacyl-CoA dehydrogenase NAD-binding dom